MNAPVLKNVLRDLGAVVCLVLASLICGLALNHVRGNLRAAPTEKPTHPATEQPAAAEVREVELQEAKQMVENRGPGMILDARPEIFYRQGHLPGALSLAKVDFEARYEQLRGKLEQNRSLPILVYCTNPECPDSESVADSLVELGYPRVLLFRGGIREWKQANLPVEKEAN